MVGRQGADVAGGNVAVQVPDRKRDQATKWLGDEKDGTAAKALKATADFQLSQKQVEKTLGDYGVAINPAYAQAAAK